MASYIGNAPVPQATQTRDRFVATAAQTSFPTSGYDVGFLDVFLNGVKLDTTDFTAINGSDVVLASGASADDVVEVVAYSTFEVLNQTFSGDTAVTGNFTVDGSVGIGTSSPSENLHIVDSAFATLQIESTGASSDPELLLTNDNGGASEWSLRLDKSKSDIFQIRYNNASKMILDTSGNVGIGTSSPSSKLHVNGIARVDNYLSMGNNGYIRGDASGELRLQSGVSGTTVYNSSNVTAHMRIDSAGRVTMPYQPAFMAHSGTYTTSGNYEFTSYSLSGASRFNQGNSFNSTTGRFTAPVSGVYQLNFVFHDKSGASSRKIGRLFLNGVSTIGDGELAENYNQFGDVGGSVCVYLAQNDYVQWGTHPLSFSGVTASAYLIG